MKVLWLRGSVIFQCSKIEKKVQFGGSKAGGEIFQTKTASNCPIFSQWARKFEKVQGKKTREIK